jgi:hypothetical protein
MPKRPPKKGPSRAAPVSGYLDIQNAAWKRPGRPTREQIAVAFAQLAGMPEPMFFEARGVRKAFELVVSLIEGAYDVCQLDPPTTARSDSVEQAAAKRRLSELYEELRDIDSLRLEMVPVVEYAARLLNDEVVQPASPRGRDLTFWTKLSPEQRAILHLQKGLHPILRDALPGEPKAAMEKLGSDAVVAQLRRLARGRRARGQPATPRSVASAIAELIGVPGGRNAANASAARKKQMLPKK